MNLLKKVTATSRLAIAAWIAVGTVCTLQADDVNPREILPNGSLGYVHIDIAQLRETPQFSIVQKFLSHVEAETSLLSTKQLGVDLTTLEQVTVVLPSFAQVSAANGEPPLCLVATFNKSFRPSAFVRQLGSEWSPQKVRDETIVVDDKNAIYIDSNQRVVFGHTEAVRHWIKTDAEAGEWSLPELMSGEFGRGQILVGVDLRSFPDELINSGPNIPAWATEIDFATLNLSFGENIGLDAQLTFDSGEPAGEALSGVRQLIETGTQFLLGFENNAQQTLANQDTSTDDAIGALFQLAAVREGAEVLEGIDLERADEWRVSAQVELDGDLFNLTYITAAIGAIGANAEETFAEVAAELDQ